MQKIRKKYQTVKAVGPELTHVRTNESEFIGFFRSLKTSGEPKSKADTTSLQVTCPSNFGILLRPLEPVFSRTNQGPRSATMVIHP